VGGARIERAMTLRCAVAFRGNVRNLLTRGCGKTRKGVCADFTCVRCLPLAGHGPGAPQLADIAGI
jgi:hypothetical protein